MQSACDSNSAVPGLESLVEATLFVGGPPLTPDQLAGILGVEGNQIVAVVAQLNQRYHQQGRPYEIRRIGRGYQMVLRPQFTLLIRRLYGRTRQVRLSQAAVEVLSLVAYKQPVTGQEIDAIRGVDSAAILRHLRRRNLIEVVDAGASGDHAVRYQITRRFLELFDLTSLEELPRVQESLPI